MKRKGLSEEQIIGILKEAEAGAPVKDLCRKHGMSNASFYSWRAKYGGMEVSDAKRLRSLEEENRRLKSIVADQALDIQLLKSVNKKRVVSSAARREAIAWLPGFESQVRDTMKQLRIELDHCYGTNNLNTQFVEDQSASESMVVSSLALNCTKLVLP